MSEEVAPLFNRRLTDQLYNQRKAELLEQFQHISEDQKVAIVLQMENDLAQIANRLRHVEKIDNLTGALSRQGFEDALSDSIHLQQERQIPFSVIFIDLGEFKKINDVEGHTKGDEALKIAKEVLSKAVRQKDFLARDDGEIAEDQVKEKPEEEVARVGGDEFLIILQGADEEGTRVVMERVLTTLQDEKERLGKDHIIQKVHFNYGYEEWQEGKTKDQFMKEVEERMYEQKRGAVGSRKDKPND